MPRGKANQPEGAEVHRDKPQDKPQGPYTVWIDYGYEGWKPTDFDTLQAALEWDRNGCSRFVISKPVRYMVQEVGEGIIARRNLSLAEPEALSGPPDDPDNPDSGRARYV